jgi:SAM-dependent methyltransferase
VPGARFESAIHRYGHHVGQDERLLLGLSFGAAATAYAEHRPDYAQTAVRWALERAPGSRVLDLGAGTGKLTATLVSLGAEVIAVEPDPAMLTELRRALPTVRALPGSAEAVPLPDASVDAVLAGNAMHWFVMNVAGPEIARVLEPGGILAGLWNVFDNRVDWVAGLERISGSAAIGPRDTFNAGAPRRPKLTSQTVAQSPSSARRSRPSSRMDSDGPPTPSSRRSRRRRECWSCQNRTKRPRSVGSALSSRADRRPLAANSPCRC